MPPRAAHKTALTANGRRYPGPGRRPPGQQQGRSGGGTGSQRWQEAETRRRPARERTGGGAGSPAGAPGAVLREGVARGLVAIFRAPRQSPTRAAGRATGGPASQGADERPRRGRAAAAGQLRGARRTRRAGGGGGATRSYRKIGGSG